MIRPRTAMSCDERRTKKRDFRALIYIREIVPGERRIEIRQSLEGEDIDLHLFTIRFLEDEVRYEVKLSGEAEHKTVKPREWLSLLHDKLARIVAKILYARETSKPEKQDLGVSAPAA